MKVKMINLIGRMKYLNRTANECYSIIKAHSSIPSRNILMVESSPKQMKQLIQNVQYYALHQKSNNSNDDIIVIHKFANTSYFNLQDLNNYAIYKSRNHIQNFNFFLSPIAYNKVYEHQLIKQFPLYKEVIWTHESSTDCIDQKNVQPITALTTLLIKHNVFSK